MKKNLPVIIASIVVLIAGYYIFSGQKLLSSSCDKIDQQKVLSEAQGIQNNKSSYSTTSKDILGKSTEGGVQTNYILNGKIILIEQKFYGETGKSEVSYYLENGNVFYFSKVNTEYLLPISEDSSGKTKSTDSKEFYLGTGEQVCSWYLDKKVQPLDQDTKDLVDYLLAGLRD